MFQKKFNSFINLNDNIFFLVLTTLIFTIWFFLVGSELLNQPFVWDDLHQVRVYSKDEILSTWVGHWDPDKVATPSYRPVATLFYSLISSLFGESFVGIRLFISVLMILLIFSINILFLKLGLKKLEIIFFTILIIFSKIFVTLLSFIILGAVIFSYMCAFFSINLFLKFLEKKNLNYYFLSIFLAFLSIFSREELYLLPCIIFLISLKKIEFNLSELKKNLYPILPFFFIVILHIVLRAKFVPEAGNFNFSNEGLFFNDKIVNFYKPVLAFVASWLPMGIDVTAFLTDGKYPFNTINFFFILSWLSFLLLSIISLGYKNIKKLIFKKKILIFLLICLMTCAPSLAYVRSFGIFLPSIFALIIISIILGGLVKLTEIKKNNKFQSSIIFFVICFTLLFGVVGGGHRSIQHIKGSNNFSAFLLQIDQSIVYHQLHQKTIPEERVQKKLQHLQSLNIYKFNTNINEYKNLSDKIKFPKYTIMDF